MVDVRYEIALKLYPYQKASAQSALNPARHPVVVVGAGPVGLALALDLGRKGTPVVVLDDQEGVGQGSRAICFARRTLEIADRLGCGDQLCAKGVKWNIGKVFHRDDMVFSFNLSPEGGLHRPAFINLQQPFFEKLLVEALRQAQADGAPIDIRGRHQVTQVSDHGDHVLVDVDTPDGPYQLEADWLIACDGARSPVRGMMGLDFKGRMFEDNFLIADVKMTAPFPTERWFWFEPTFENAGQSALLHKQPDDIWRMDFQLGWNIDRQAELNPARIHERVKAMLGQGVDYELVWTSIYTFHCRRLETFRHNRVLFAGDSAHQVSPFGARGANSGVQDADNLAWKLDLVVRGKAPDRLLNSYCDERVYAADENILNSSRATDFLTPKSEISRIFRNAVLDLARRHSFARVLVNSGRLSTPCFYDGMPLNGPDLLSGPAVTRVGAACPDAPLRDGFLLDRLGNEFVILAINTPVPDQIIEDGIHAKGLALGTEDDVSGFLAARYLGAAASGVYLIRPDQHVAARWPNFDEDAMRAALRRATGKDNGDDAQT